MNVPLTHTLLSVSGLAGSAGTVHSTDLVSTAITPQGIPPKLALPVTTVRAQFAKCLHERPTIKETTLPTYISYNVVVTITSL